MTFEEKQRLDLKDKENIMTNPAMIPLNFRYGARKATPAVVHVKTLVHVKEGREIPDFFRDFFGDDFWRNNRPPGGSSPQVQIGSASGVIISSDGYIVTNNHVIAESDSIEVVLHDQRSYRAKVVGTDPATDLALLKIAETRLPFMEFGNSDSLEVGDWVLAVGNPFNLASTVTAGIVSAKARNINILTDRLAVESFIQTDAAANPGNSGGALVDINGRLVGINTAIATPTGSYAGYSFAIPVDIVKKTIDDLLLYGKALRGYLGIIMGDMDGEQARLLGMTTYTGVVIDSLLPNSAAIQAGLKKRDVIVKADDHVIETAPQLREIIARHHSGEKLQLTVIRAGKEKTIPVILKPFQETAGEATIDRELLRSLGIDIVNLSDDEKNKLHIPGGVKVTKIGNGPISKNTDMEEGFIITKVNNKPVKNAGDFVDIIQHEKGGIMLEGVYPDLPGTYYYAFGL